MIKILSCISIAILFSNPLYSMDATESVDFEYLKSPKCEVCVSSSSPIFDEEKYVQMGGYGFIQPEFMDRVLAKDAPETLEICAGHGNVLKSILEKQSKTPDSPPIRYTVVENSATNMAKIQKAYKDFKRKDNWVGCAQKDVVEFLTTNLEKKRNKYDQVFAGFALHILGAQSFLTVINGLFDVLKEGGFLYITQHSFSGSRYDGDYIENVMQGKLLPFWNKGQFSSDPTTMKNLLKAFGFEVVKSGLYQELHLQNDTQTKYLGIIAQKKADLYNEKLVSEYRQSLPLSFTELDCVNDVSGCKMRLSSTSPTSKLWSIHDDKVGLDEYDALKVYTRDIGENNLLLERFEIHPNNQWLVRALNAFLTQATNNQFGYKTISAIATEGHIVSKILNEFDFVKDETSPASQGMIMLKASVAAIKKKLR